MKKIKKNKNFIAILIDDELKNEIEKRAKLENRTITNWIKNILIQTIENKK